MADPYEILKHPLNTEKAVREMEASNCLIFIVADKANKNQIKWAIEKEFKAKVTGVRTFIDRYGKKKAYIQLHPDTPAIDVTTKLGLV